MNIESQKIGFKGHFELSVRNSETGECREYKFQNLITDAGLDRFGTATTLIYVALGTGNAAPAFTDTALQSHVRSALLTAPNSATSFVDPTDSNRWVHRYVHTASFTLGSVVGNISEIGTGWSLVGAVGTAINGLFSRALILDSNGVPASITVLNTEQVELSYIVDAYVSILDVTTTVVVSGTSHTIVTRPNAVNFVASAGFGIQGTGPTVGSLGLYDGVLQSHTSNNPSSNPTSMTNTPSQSGVYQNYVNGSYERIVTTSFTTTQGIAPPSGGIDVMQWGAAAAYKFACSVVPPILKDNTKTMTLTFRISWGRL